jgi:ribose transport system ATP-binding protein
VSLLCLRNVSKTFPGTRALRAVDLEVEAGEIHALIGQNGSGKSTLIKVLAGFHHPDPGAEAWFDGEPFALTDARHDGLRFVHQDLGLVPELSALENLAMIRGYAQGRLGRIRWREQRALTHAALARCGLRLDVDRPLAAASPVERTMVAIAAALLGWEGGRGVLVLDEPTAVLPAGEVSRLFELVRELRASGTSVLYVSHRLDELFELCDRVTVLRHGERVDTRGLSELTGGALARLMVGEAPEQARAVEPPASDQPIVLEARGLQARYLRSAAFELRAGEAVGVCGLPGSGAEELPYAIAGKLDGPARGELRSRDGEWRPIRRARAPIVPPDRIRQGIVSEFSVAENLTLGLPAEGSEARIWTERLAIKTAGVDAAITTLSGGNQQKVVIARCLARETDVAVLCEPTAGVDIASRAAIHQIIRDRVDKGLSVVVSSTDTGDLLALCSRVMVFRDGVVARELRGSEITELALVHAMEGSDEHAG